MELVILLATAVNAWLNWRWTRAVQAQLDDVRGDLDSLAEAVYGPQPWLRLVSKDDEVKP